MTKFAQDVEAISDVIAAQRARIAELESVLREIVREYDQTYDGEVHNNGLWSGAASIPVEVMKRAQALLKRPESLKADPFANAPLTGPGSRLQSQLGEMNK